MTIDLPQEQQQFIEQQIASGRYADESAVMVEALALWQRQQQKMSEIRAAVEAGNLAADEGRGTLITTPEEAEAFKQSVIKQGRELRAGRPNTTH